MRQARRNEFELRDLDVVRFLDITYGAKAYRCGGLGASIPGKF